MFIRSSQSGVYADLGDVWLHDQLARLTQRRAQFGGHYRIDADALLARLAHTTRQVKAAALARSKASTGEHIRRATIEAVKHCARLGSHAPPSPPCTERYTRSQLDSNLHDLAALAVPSEFLPIQRLDPPARDEWKATLSDGTEIVVADIEGKPNRLGIEKAIAIVQSRAYLEARARQLLVPLGKNDGQWRLVAIDFGVNAQQHDCEFLMCFAFQATQSDFADTSPYVEVGFALPVRMTVGAVCSPSFILMIQTTPPGQVARSTLMAAFQNRP